MKIYAKEVMACIKCPEMERLREYEGTGNLISYCGGRDMPKQIPNIMKIPSWCPLPDAPKPESKVKP